MSGDYFGFNTTQTRTLQRLIDEQAAGSIGTAELANGAVTAAKLASMTSAELAGKVSNETGTGLLVFATNPVLTTPNLGTPSALVLTNATGLVNAGVDAAAAIAATKLAVAAGTSGLAATNAQVSIQAAYTAIANLNAWAAALATKLNADAGVTDTNYDTDPQT